MLPPKIKEVLDYATEKDLLLIKENIDFLIEKRKAIKDVLGTFWGGGIVMSIINNEESFSKEIE